MVVGNKGYEMEKYSKNVFIFPFFLFINIFFFSLFFLFRGNGAFLFPFFLFFWRLLSSSFSHFIFYIFCQYSRNSCRDIIGALMNDWGTPVSWETSYSQGLHKEQLSPDH